MNPIVFALRRPLTVMVLVAAVALASLVAVTRMAIDFFPNRALPAWAERLVTGLPFRMSIDIFPNLNLPVVYVAQPYGGMDPAQMEGLLTNYYEYHFLYINGIHHVESRNIQGMALMKLYFHPGTNMAQAMAEVIGYVTRSRAFMPPGTVSPFITRFDAGSVPVGYLVLSSETKSIGEIQDQALFKVRPMFASLPGVSAPPPFGGNQRTVVVRIDPDRLRSYKMSPDEVIAALSAGNTISPSGTVRIGKMMPIVPINSLVRQVQELETIPVRPGQDPTVYLRDVATVQDSSDIPTGYALVNGRRAVYILVTKRADASTVSVVNNVKKALPSMQAVLPDDITVSFAFDQSPTVTNAVLSLAAEGALGAVLTGLMVLLFLRDWRSVIVVVLNIPFALCGALMALWVTGQTINLMTLGGLALSIGILVDESTVEVENIHHQMEGTSSVARAVRRGNQQTAIPRLLAMLCVLAVFLPSFLMQGAAQALFVPLALAVGFAMVASYLLSSTFVPVLSTWLLRHHHHLRTGRAGSGDPRPSGRRSLFECGRDAYGRAVGRIVRWRWLIVPAYLAGTIAVIVLVGRSLGLEIFPKVAAGRFQLRMRAPDGTRYEETERLAIAALETIAQEVGRDRVAISIGYVGLIPSSYPINAIYQWTGGPEEAILRVALKEGAKVDIERLEERLRGALATRLPDVRLSFEPADIVSEVMSFGSPTPVDVAVTGPNLADDRAFAEKLRHELAEIPSLRDLQYSQSLDYPTVRIELDRERAGLSGVTAEDVARSVVTATSSSRFVVPNYWPDPKTGIGYQVQVEIPYQVMDSLERVETVPIQKPGLGRQILLRDVAQVRPGTMPGQFDRYNMKRSVSLTANIAGEDLGRVAGRLEQAIQRAGAPPKGAVVDVRGQIRPLEEILRGLGIGLGMSIVVILLLLTANFQSVRLALVVVSTTPAVIAGVVLMLWLTGTTLNLQSFMGSIMAIGVAVANAILLVTFAEGHRREANATAGQAAVEGARGRLRPILMTSCAMIAGMVPMALGWGEGSEQTAPLGRAVIGGLVAATLTTLTVLPTVFALVQGPAGRESASLDPDDPESPHYHEEEAEESVRASANGEPDGEPAVLVGTDHASGPHSARVREAQPRRPRGFFPPLAKGGFGGVEGLRTSPSPCIWAGDGSTPPDPPLEARKEAPSPQPSPRWGEGGRLVLRGALPARRRGHHPLLPTGEKVPEGRMRGSDGRCFEGFLARGGKGTSPPDPEGNRAQSGPEFPCSYTLSAGKTTPTIHAMPRTAFALIQRMATGTILLAPAAGCAHSPEGKDRPTAPPVTRVEVVRPERHTVRRIVGEPGELEAFETTAIHAKIPGYVRSWTVNLGAAVRKGQVLAELSVPELEAELQQKRAAIEQADAKSKQAKAAVKVAEANVAGAQAKLAEVRAGVKRTEADLVYAQAQTKRITGLVSGRAVTESLLDEVHSKLHSAESALAEVQAQVKTAEVAVIQTQAALDQAWSDVGAATAAIKFAQEDAHRAEAMLRYTRIEAPFDGIVTQRNVDTGALTQPGADQPPLFIIARSDLMTIRVDVPEVFATEVNPGDHAVVKLQAMKGKVVEGTVSRISWALDPKVRTLRVEIDIPNPGAKLQPGLYAYATVIAEEHPDVLTIPATAVVSEQGKDYCVAVGNGKAARRPIQVGLGDGTRTEVISGLNGSETVVKANAAALHDGQDVRIEQPPAR